MNFIIDILKGAVMGIANVIPGVSGGTMAVAMGIYDKLITSLTHIFKEFKKSVMTVLPIGIGMVIGIIGLSMIIEWMFGTVPIQTNLLFIGLILGGVPAIWARVKGHKVKAGYIIGFILFFALVIALSFVQAGTEKEKEALKASEETETEAFYVETGVVPSAKYVAAGVVASGTMVIPGVSGSMMMMVMGLYEKVIGSISNIVKALTAGDFATVGMCCGLLIPFAIGAVIGIFLIAKLIEMLLSKYSVPTFWCIMGLIAGSPIAIIVVNADIFAGINAVSGITGVLFLAVGFVIAFFLGRDREETKADE
ncbi:MAG: DUF368 domain-containing protein [Lachnospiraceae bacterium]|nr:DUF368 domain-containing protein [Lachnospiraceae bacterium]